NDIRPGGSRLGSVRLGCQTRRGMAMIVHFSGRAGHLFLTGHLVLLTLGAAGCGRAKGDLSGKVSYQGKPLALGSVLLIGTNAKPRTAWIEEDGSYRFDDVPVGEAKLAVYSPDPAKQRKKLGPKGKQIAREEPVAQGFPAVDRTKWFAIPDEYSD